MNRPLRVGLLACAAVAVALVLVVILLWVAFARTANPSLALVAVEARLGLLPAADAHLVKEAVRLRRRNPSQEADAALQRRDYRLIALSSFGLSIPGAPRLRDSAYYSKHYGIRETVGVGDTGNQYTLLYQNEAYRFALAYNLVILRRVGEKTEN